MQQLTPEEIERLGEEIYDRSIRKQLRAKDDGRVVAIDVTTGVWAIDDDVIPAALRLRVERPDADVWFVRVGHRALHQMGGHRLRARS